MRIAMWSGPRNISTAMLRSFGNRCSHCARSLGSCSDCGALACVPCGGPTDCYRNCAWSTRRRQAAQLVEAVGDLIENPSPERFDLVASLAGSSR